VQGVQDTVRAVHGQVEVIPGCFLGNLRVVPADAQVHIERGDLAATADAGWQFNL